MAQAHYANPAIQKAFTILKTLSADEETRLRVEVRERALKDAISELAAAKDEGRAVLDPYLDQRKGNAPERGSKGKEQDIQARLRHS